MLLPAGVDLHALELLAVPEQAVVVDLRIFVIVLIGYDLFLLVFKERFVHFYIPPLCIIKAAEHVDFLDSTVSFCKFTK